MADLLDVGVPPPQGLEVGGPVGEAVDVGQGAPVGDYYKFGCAIFVFAIYGCLAEDYFRQYWSLRWEEVYVQPDSCVDDPFNSSVIFLKNVPTVLNLGSNTPNG